MILDLLVLLFLVVSLFKIRPIFVLKTFNDNYLSIKNCNSYRGIFALLVITHHLAQRTTGGLHLPDFTRVGYLAVAVFFFLSGYGLQKKNLSDDDYSRGFLIKRIPTVLIPYLLMTAIYWSAYALLGEVKTISSMWDAFVKYGEPIVWFSWYVVCILVFYFVFFVLIKMFKKNRIGMVLGCALYYALYVFICRKLNFGMWWYSTALLLTLGVCWASYEESILKFIKRTYFILLPLCWTSFVLLSKYKWDIYWKVLPSEWTDFAITVILGLLFVVGVVILYLKVNFGNKVLNFLGKISFEIYMVQGLIMLLTRNDFLKIENDFLWATSVIAGSVGAAYILNKLFGIILKKYNGLIKKTTTV